MEKCNRCGKTIETGDDYVDLVVWVMNDGEGHETGEVTICEECHLDFIDFLKNGRSESQ